MNPSTHFTTILLHQFLLQSTHSPPRRVKYDFESTPNCDFTTHCEDRHNVWSYLYFVMHLRNKERTEYTSHEQYVADLVDRDSISFFPMGVALDLIEHQREWHQ